MIISCLAVKQKLLNYFERVLEPKFSAARLAGLSVGSFGLLAVSAQRTVAVLVVKKLVAVEVGLFVGPSAELGISELRACCITGSQGTESSGLGRKEAGKQR